jgi:hypothetical protein
VNGKAEAQSGRAPIEGQPAQQKSADPDRVRDVS